MAISKNLKNKKKNYNIAPVIEPRNIKDVTDKTGNIYASVNVMAQRSNQIASALKEELQSKLHEFSSQADNLEEVNENKEQIEISRFYERIPHATLLSFEEFMDNKINYTNNKKTEVETID